MRPLTFLLALGGTVALADVWNPPAQPDPEAILTEAGADRRAGRYAVALAKHEWFHDHAVAIDPGMGGVRLSFALADWQELAKQYPPALVKLEAKRANARKLVIAALDQESTFDAFHDFAAISGILGDEGATKDLFVAMERGHPDMAKVLLLIARPALVRAKEYRLLAKYIEPDTDFERLAEAYRRQEQMARDPKFGDEMAQFARKMFANEAATMVALLAVDGRTAEAGAIDKRARAVLDDAEFRATLDEAIRGVVPDPWP